MGFIERFIRKSRTPDVLEVARPRAFAHTHGEFHLHAGRALAEQGFFDAALTEFEMAIAAHPEDPLGYLERGYALKDLGALGDARAALSRALEIFPRHVLLLNAYGLVMSDLGLHEAALASYSKALEVDPLHAGSKSNASRELLALARLDEAIDRARQALAIDPKLSSALETLKTSLFRSHRVDEALVVCQTITQIAPTNAAGLMRRAAAHEELGEHQGALRDYLEAHRLAPANPYAALNVGLAALRLSRYDIGWKMWESRRFVPTFRSLSPEIASRALHWDGTASLANKTIFVYPEQGYGDGVQFMRYLDQLTAMNAIVLLGLPAALEPLYAAVPGVTLLMQGETIGAIDFHCPLTSIPAALLEAGVEIGIPPPFRPIAGEAKATAWAKTLGPRVKPRIGLVVSGSAAHNNDANRSIALAELAPLLSLPFEFVLLQPDLRATDAATAVQFGVKTLTQGLRDFSDTAAIAGLCDLVISVDSAPAHVVASLGRPTWLLLPYLADWRWGIMTESSPWYPSLRLWRQGRDRQWSNVIDRARLQLLASPELDGMAS